MLGPESAEQLVAKISQYCFSLVQSRVFSSSGPEVENYTHFIQQELLKRDKKNPFLTVHEVENRHERLNNLVL